VADAHERFLAAPDGPLGDAVRAVVADSWRRSWRAGVDPGAPGAPLDLSDGDLAAYRDSHPLAAAMPLVRHLLAQDAEEAGHIVAVGDAAGRLLWVEGHRGLRRRAESMRFVEGALWSEGGVGTNAPGTALALAAPVQIAAEEHFGLGIQPWSCVASPIRDLRTGTVVGVVDLTGGHDLAGPRSLALVRACAAAIESQLLLTGMTGPAAPPEAPARRLTVAGPPGDRLDVLGTDAANLRLRGGTRVRLSRRHTEIVWLLGRSARGMSVQALDAALHRDGSHLVTVRAEMARLRRVLDAAGAGDVLRSRPYRLAVPVVTDVDELRRLLARGAVHKALDLFTGPPLPGSDAPAVVAAREEVVAELRQAVLRSRSAGALERWTSREAGHDDAAAWELLETCLPYGSPKRATARAHRLRLATQLATPLATSLQPLRS
jgi:transcriptional regulator of acetoin/glycerol metabolism